MTKSIHRKRGRNKTVKANPRWISRDASLVPDPFPGWDSIMGFASRGFSIWRDGDVLRLWWADVQAGEA